MLKAYKVNFQYSENTYCANIATAATPADIDKEYSIYKWYSYHEATPAELDEATRKGMPVIQLSMN
jgi:hypothetical protein